ncbi:MAG: GNAT family N-acetyltransferase [Gammaproteobacteria bacterium]|nr:GNAT family N-acetyltransferase [Gammaproteobacteria bacterium]
MHIRPYEEARDFEAVKRIWFEIGWIDSEASAEYLKGFLSLNNCLTGVLDDAAECLVMTTPGSIRYENDDLRMCAVTAVTTSRVARKQRMAQQLTALQLAAGAEAGDEVAVLGMFEQGFYDRVGFGTGSYIHTIKFDPASLMVDSGFRPPKRLTKDDWKDVSAALLARKRGHGGAVLNAPEMLKAELGWSQKENGFGLGYYDGSALTHFMWFVTDAVEFGPYSVVLYAYQSSDQLMELLALLKSLGDQVSMVEMQEPYDVQLQTLLRQPFRHRRNSKASVFANQHNTSAWWQLRILDVAACVAKRHWVGQEVSFNLVLEDPVELMLQDSNWQGCGGDYHVNFGTESGAERGHAEGLPTLNASVNAFSRLLFGIAPASSLAITDDLHTEPELLARLDEALLLPTMHLGWDF